MGVRYLTLTHNGDNDICDSAAVGMKYKCWYYQTALQDGNEDRIRSMLPDGLPPEIQKLYDNTHD